MALDAKDLSIEISQDKMEATGRVKNSEILGSITRSDILAAVSQRGINYGVIEDAAENMANSPVADTPFIVARGTASQPGEDERIEYTFPIEDIPLVEDDESGSIDFKNISNFNNTKEGDVLAKKIPSKPGIDGSNVKGEVVKARQGKTANMRIGKGAELSSDEQSVIAQVSGHACVIADRITVLSTVEVPAHIDYSIGNIDFIGNVKVRGGVMPGFKVIAAGDIEIAGNVEKASITCGGNLSIRGIVFGHEDCEIKVKGNAEINAIDQATIEVGGSLVVHSYIRHCIVRAGEKIEVQEGKGSIVGGDIAALTLIKAPFIGNNMATLTKLSVGTNPFASGTLDSVQSQYDELSKKLEQVNNGIYSLRSRITMSGGGGDKLNPMMEKLKQAQAQLEPAVTKLNEQLTTLKEASSDFKDAKIRISEKVFPGVVINFRDKLQYKTMDEAQRLTFFEEGAEIRTGPF